MRAILSRKLVAIAKPRCGSTSLRRMLNPFVDKAKGDLAVDVGEKGAVLHPHITAPALRRALAGMGHDLAGVTFIMTTRHPVDMLWSYWSFFRPDGESRYSFSASWRADEPMPFEDWLDRGTLMLNADWLALAPQWISARDLSGLSLDFRAADRSGQLAVDRVFCLEEPEVLTSWLSNFLGAPVSAKHVNQSGSGDRPDLGSRSMARVKAMLPADCALYGI